MKLAPTLFTRGLVIITVPILCQVVFVMHLIAVLNDIQENRERESQSFHLIRAAYLCFRETTEEIVTTALAVGLGKEASPEEKKQRLTILVRNSLLLAERIESDPRQKKNAADLRQASKVLSDRLTLAIPQNSSTSWHVDYYKQRRPLEESTLVYLDVVAKVVDVEEKQNAADTVAANESISKLVFVFVLAVAGSILVAVLLARYYAVSISNPLKHLNESGTRLSELRTLPTPIEGAAEFSEADALLHLVSNEVEGALNREKEVVANAVDLICSLDRDEVFQVANPYAERMLGYTSEELIGRHLSEFAVGVELLAAIDKMRTTVQTGALATFELRMRRKDEGLVDTKWSCVWSPLHQMFFCVVNDITEQKRAEQLKLDFSETVSDDLRSPLVAMQSSLSALIKGNHGALSTEVSTTLTKTSKNVDRLILLANELLDFQKIKGGKMQIDLIACDLNQIVEEAVDCISIMAEPKHITLHLPKGSFHLECDRTKILQTVVNLLSNAIKFSPVSSSIEIAIREGAQHIELQVIDSGPGIPAEYQQRIFEPFEQLPSAQAKVGTGLGLAICKMIVETHGGTIEVAAVDPSKGTGSIFTIKLPKKPIRIG